MYGILKLYLIKDTNMKEYEYVSIVVISIGFSGIALTSPN